MDVAVCLRGTFLKSNFKKIKEKAKGKKSFFRKLMRLVFAKSCFFLIVRPLNGQFRLGSKLCCPYLRQNSVCCIVAFDRIRRNLLIALFFLTSSLTDYFSQTLQAVCLNRFSCLNAHACTSDEVKTEWPRCF